MTNETKHTPGKWHECDDCEHIILAYDAESDRMNELALVYAWDGKKTHLANRRLIACAPELLKALEALVDDEECRFDHHGCCQTHDLSNPCNMQYARNVIAKAKGGTQ